MAAGEEDHNLAREDAREIHEVMEAATRVQPARPGWSELPEAERLGMIRRRYGSSARDGGSLILTRTDIAYYQHPGYNADDYHRTERVITDHAIIRRARAVLAQGDRTRTYRQMLDYRYDIETY